MGAMSNYTERAVLRHLFLQETFTPPTYLYVALFTQMPDNNEFGGVEVGSGIGYSRRGLYKSWTVGATDTTVTASRTRPGCVRTAARLDLAATGNATFSRRTHLSAEATVRRVRTTRVRDDAFHTEGDTILTVDPLRVRDQRLTLSSHASTDIDASVLASGSFTLGTVLSAEVIGYATMDGAISLDATGDLRAKATPILVITYEDVQGRVRQALATAELHPATATTRHAPRVTVHDGRPIPRVRLPRSRR